MKTILAACLMALIVHESAYARQMELSQVQTAEITLAGYNHVPPVRSPGLGTVTVTLRSDTLIIEGTFRDLRDVYRSSSIQFGSPSESGNRLFGLSVDLDEDRRSGTFRKEDNRYQLRASLLEALRDGNLYISIASARHQAGEIRGQIPAMRNPL